MNGTRQWLRGTLLTFGVALAFASVACVNPDPGSDTDDDSEEVGSASQQLDEFEAPPPPPEEEEESTGAPDVDEGAVADGNDGEPQPVPWRVFLGASSPLPDDIDPSDPLGTPQAATPSSGHSGK